MEDPMRLSEAIRLGAMLRPQAFGKMFRTVRGEMRSCALGAAAEALGESPYDSFAPLFDAMRMCPMGCGWTSVGSLIPHLNDEHRWTRERIADWVETVEIPEAAVVSVSTRV
jgi:hypothetical protein